MSQSRQTHQRCRIKKIAYALLRLKNIASPPPSILSFSARNKGPGTKNLRLGTPRFDIQESTNLTAPAPIDLGSGRVQAPHSAVRLHLRINERVTLVATGVLEAAHAQNNRIRADGYGRLVFACAFCWSANRHEKRITVSDIIFLYFQRARNEDTNEWQQRAQAIEFFIDAWIDERYQRKKGCLTYGISIENSLYAHVRFSCG